MASHFCWPHFALLPVVLAGCHLDLHEAERTLLSPSFFVGNGMDGELEVVVNSVGRETQLAALIEAAVVYYGLQIRMRGTLRTSPGSQHWHLQKPGARGTLEVTLWPARNRLWLSVQAGRGAAWITEILPSMKAWLEEQQSQLHG